MFQVLALATEELTHEPVKLLGEDCDLILQLLMQLLKFLIYQGGYRFKLMDLSPNG
jgi:hypothetical protein